jgi:hypothetical protein
VKRWKVAAVGSGIVLAVTGGVAWATIPDGSGQIHACYKTGSGELRVVDPSAGGTCKPSESALVWSQTGPAGADGATSVAIRTHTQTVTAGGSFTFTALCEPGEKATGGGWRMDGPVPSGAPPVTVLGTVPQSSSPEPAAGETPIGWKVIGASSQDGSDHDVTAFAVCAAP